MRRTKLLCGIVLSWMGACLPGCGDFVSGTESGNPTNVGTESGNPINPPQNPVVEPMVVIGEESPTLEEPMSGSPSPEEMGAMDEELTELPPLDMGSPEPVPSSGDEELEIPGSNTGSAGAPSYGDMVTAPSAGSAGGLANGATGAAGEQTSGIGGSDASESPSAAESAPCDAAQCQAQADAAVTELAMSTISAEAATVVSATCTQEGSCECVGGGDQILNLAASADGCHVFNRVGECVFSQQEFAGCEPTEASSCEVPCEGALAALVQAGEPQSSSVLEAQCVPDAGCRFVLQVDPSAECVLGGDDLQLGLWDCSQSIGAGE